MSNRSKRYTASKSLIEEKKIYTPADAVGLAKQMVGDKAAQAVELHVKLGIDPKKQDQSVRGTVELPHGTGKTVRIAAFVMPNQVEAVKAAGADIIGGEELIKVIKEKEALAADVAVAQPELMKSLATIAKFLGTRGLMPNPKDETVTTTPAKIVEKLKKGRASFRNDVTGNVHVTVGRTTFTPEQLNENVNAALDAIKRAKPSSSKGTYMRSITVTTTFGPGIPVSA